MEAVVPPKSKLNNPDPKSGSKNDLPAVNIPKLTGGAFLVRKTDPMDIFIAEEWTEEQKMMVETVHDFIFAEVHPRITEIDSQKDPGLVPSILDKSAEMGLTALFIPEAYGGLEMDFNSSLLFGEAVALGFSFATVIGCQTSIGSLPIVYYGTEAQKEKYLPQIATSELKSCYCLTEPDAGSDANSGKSKAILNPSGTHYILNGQKMWITNGGFADIFIVFAKIDDDKNLSAFIVEKAFGGIQIGEEEKKMGIKGSSTVQVFFNDCLVPVENLLGKRGEGFKIALNILNSGRARLASGSVGGGKMGTHQSIKYANERKQFDTPISSFGAIQFKLAEMTIRTFAAESAVYRTGKNIDTLNDRYIEAGYPKNEARLNAIREFAIECALIKVYGSEVLDYVVDESVQIHGGMGYAEEAMIERGYRDARITRIYEGTNEINRMLSVGELFKKAFKDKRIDMVKPVKQLPGYLLKRMFSFGSSDPFQEAEKAIEDLKQVFLFIAGRAGQKFKLKLIDEQEIIINLSDILAEVYVAESTLLRVQKMYVQKELSEAELQLRLDILQVYLYEAIEKVNKAGKDAIFAFTKGQEQRIMMWMLKRLTRQIKVNPKMLRRNVAQRLIEADSYCF